MSENRGKRKRGETELETEKKRKTKRGKKEKEGDRGGFDRVDDLVLFVEDHGDVVVIEEDNDDEIEQRERRSVDVFGKREQQNEGEEGEREREREEVVMKRKEEEEKKKRFECGICLELMNWEKEPRLLPCCGLSFCFPCLTKLFLLQNPSSSPSSSSSSSSSSPSLKGVKCPVCCEINECESVETLSMNYLIPETIDVLLSSNLISFSNQLGFFLHFLNSHFLFSFSFLLFFLFFDKNLFQIVETFFFEKQDLNQSVQISKRVENKLKCIVLIVKCLFVILVIHFILQRFSLKITNDLKEMVLREVEEEEDWRRREGWWEWDWRI